MTDAHVIATTDEDHAMSGWERYVTKYGAATVIACFLVWWMANDVTGTLKTLQKTLNEHVGTSNFYLRQVCLNTAQNENQRAACIPGER